MPPCHASMSERQFRAVKGRVMCATRCPAPVDCQSGTFRKRASIASPCHVRNRPGRGRSARTRNRLDERRRWQGCELPAGIDAVFQSPSSEPDLRSVRHRPLRRFGGLKYINVIARCLAQTIRNRPGAGVINDCLPTIRHGPGRPAASHGNSAGSLGQSHACLQFRDRQPAGRAFRDFAVIHADPRGSRRSMDCRIKDWQAISVNCRLDGRPTA